MGQMTKKSRLTIRGDDDLDLVSSEEVWTGPPIALLVRVQCFGKDLYKAVEGPRPIVPSMITGSFFRR